MKRFLWVAMLVAICSMTARLSFAGDIYVTGHNLDFSCAGTVETSVACNGFAIAINVAKAGAPDRTKPVLFLDQGYLTDSGTQYLTQAAAINANNDGFVTGPFVVVDPTSSAFSTLPLTTANYSAILIASECDGCDNDAAGETAINGRASDIQSFFNSGGGLVYLGAGSGNLYYASIPANFAVVPTNGNCDSAGCPTLTSLGTALGLTNADATSGFENSFAPPGFEGGSSSLYSEAEFDGSENSVTLFATSSPPSVEGSSTAILTFPPGNNSSAIGTFNCSSNQIPCPDPGAHSMKFTVANVSSTFSIMLVATDEDAVVSNGVCESGIPGDPSDPLDCRFVRYFGEPPFNGGPPFVSTNVPLCYAYSSSTNSAPFHCVFYSVQGAPPPPTVSGPPSPYTGPVLEAIAWNTLETPGAGFVNSPRMYDDPSDDLNICNCYPTIHGGAFSSFPYSLNSPPYNVEDNQFVFDITTFFNPNPGTVGTDPTTGGKTQTFNDFVIAFPRTIAQVQQPVNSDGSSVFNAKRGVVPIKFNLLQDGVATCNLPAATLSLTRLTVGEVGPVDENLYTMAADSGSSFRISGCQYIYNLAASAVGVGQYKVEIIIGTEVVGIAYFELK